jgi:hypothetical protein
LKWKVIFFRDQNLNHAQHVAMSKAIPRSTRSPRSGLRTRNTRR